MNDIALRIKEIIDSKYNTNEYPSLFHQIESWGTEKPLRGLKILDATPVFRNTMVKYMALIAAGAELSVGVSDVMPHDPKIVEFLKNIGVDIVNTKQKNRCFDIILDCAGSFSGFDAKLGYVELTRSGIEQYGNCTKAVFIADSGKIKRIETLLGTGESLFRAMSSLGYDEWKEKNIVVFGSGKVGSGIVIYGNSLGAKMTVITDLESLSENIAAKTNKSIDYKDITACTEVVKNADLIVTATGIKGAIADPKLAEAIKVSPALLANMGVEDEFGSYIPTNRVLNDKKPLNFILEEPTHLKYIETTMALHNTGALYIASNPSATGIINPPSDIEEQLLAVTHRNGIIANELKFL